MICYLCVLSPLSSIVYNFYNLQLHISKNSAMALRKYHIIHNTTYLITVTVTLQCALTLAL